MSAMETQEEKCARCLEDGLRDDEDCEFYGEPNGCNSPEYGQYPKNHFGNMAKMRNALNSALSFIGNLEIEPYSHLDEVASELKVKILDALSSNPRNCDVYAREQVRMAYHLYGDGLMTMQAVVDWLYSDNKKRGDELAFPKQEREVK